MISISQLEKRTRFHYCKNEGFCVKTFASCQTCGVYLCLTKERNIAYYMPLFENELLLCRSFVCFFYCCCFCFFPMLQICKDFQFSNTKIKNSKIQTQNKIQTLRKSYSFLNKVCTRREYININNYNNSNNNNNNNNKNI